MWKLGHDENGESDDNDPVVDGSAVYRHDVEGSGVLRIYHQNGWITARLVSCHVLGGRQFKGGFAR